MENTYGIGIANRYDLFYGSDDGADPFEMIAKKKAPKVKEPAPASGNVNNTQQHQSQPKSQAVEKENKQVTLNKNQKDAANNQIQASQQQRNGQDSKNGPRRGIKEQQNNGNKVEQKKEPGFNTTRNFNNSKPSGGENQNREERNNRRNRENVNGVTEFTDKPRGGQGQGGQGGQGGAGGNRNGNRRNFDGRIKRERDRQSGSDKTGVKAVDKRDGGGAHNWGHHKQDLEDFQKNPQPSSTDDEAQKDGHDDGHDEQPPAPIEDEVKEMTLDEWKAQRNAQRLKPEYNIRKAGEGEDGKQWDKMVKLDKKGDELNGQKKDDGPRKDDGKKKQVLEIEFHFNDGRRGGLGRGRGGRGPGGQGGGGNRRPNRGPPRGDGEERSHDDDGQRERRQRRPRYQERGTGHGHGHAHAHDAPHAPKVDDERDFPSLG